MKRAIVALCLASLLCIATSGAAATTSIDDGDALDGLLPALEDKLPSTAQDHVEFSNGCTLEETLYIIFFGGCCGDEGGWCF